MPDEPRESPTPQHPDVHYEKTDLSLRWVIGLLVFALASGLMIHLLLWVYFDNERDRLDAERRSEFPLAPTPSDRLPPQPRLEQIDRLNGTMPNEPQGQLAAKVEALRHYGSAEEKGFVRIPITRAIELTAQRLKSSAGKVSDRRSNGLFDFGESNSGRLFRKEAPWHAR